MGAAHRVVSPSPYKMESVGGGEMERTLKRHLVSYGSWSGTIMKFSFFYFRRGTHSFPLFNGKSPYYRINKLIKLILSLSLPTRCTESIIVPDTFVNSSLLEAIRVVIANSSPVSPRK